MNKFHFVHISRMVMKSKAKYLNSPWIRYIHRERQSGLSSTRQMECRLISACLWEAPRNLYGNSQISLQVKKRLSAFSVRVLRELDNFDSATNIELFSNWEVDTYCPSLELFVFGDWLIVSGYIDGGGFSGCDSVRHKISRLTLILFKSILLCIKSKLLITSPTQTMVSLLQKISIKLEL